MAFMRFEGATTALDLTSGTLANFGSAEQADSNFYSFISTAKHDIEAKGTGLTYSNARPTGGTINEVTVDLFNNSVVPDIKITGLEIDATTIDDGTLAFWDAVLSENDIINVQGLDTEIVGAGRSVVFADDLRAKTGSSSEIIGDTGARDTFITGNGTYTLIGDVHTVEGSSVVLPEKDDLSGGSTSEVVTKFAIYEGGNDFITGTTTFAEQQFVGDAFSVFQFGTLFGGDDKLSIASKSKEAFVIGDAAIVEGLDPNRLLAFAESQESVAKVVGGNDTITGLDPVRVEGSRALLIGDVGGLGDNAIVIGGRDTITGSDEAEQMSGDITSDNSDGGSSSLEAGGDVIDAGGGSDTIAGDVLFDNGEAIIIGGSDTINGGEANDIIFGEIGSSTLDSVQGGNDQLFGDLGNDKISGQTGNDLISGGGGNDTMDGGAGIDTLQGGANNDAYIVDFAGDKIIELANEGTDTVLARISFVLGAEVEKVELAGSANLNGAGNGLANVLTGNAGNNILDGKAGADTMAGKTGNDTYIVDNAGDKAVELSNQGIDLVRSGVSFTLGANVERLILLGSGDIAATGNALDNILVGNLGANLLTGGDGDDVFAFNTKLGAGNVDAITDFNVQDDLFQLENAIFTGLSAGKLAASAFRIGTAAGDANDRIVYDTQTGSLLFDKDGTGAAAAISFATVDPGTAVSAADFLIV